MNKLNIKFNPNKYKTPSGAAKSFHKALVKYAKENEYPDPDRYVMLLSPKESQERGFGHGWRVMWEDGPHEWGVDASMDIYNQKDGWFTEPYYSFDVGFYPA